MAWGYRENTCIDKFSNLFARSLTFSNFALVFCLVHDQVYIQDEICVYASLD